MAGHQKDPLRPLTPDEHTCLDRVSQSCIDPAAQVARAKELLTVADGASYVAAARAAGRRSAMPSPTWSLGSTRQRLTLS